jgi:hypothetical protein
MLNNGFTLSKLFIDLKLTTTLLKNTLAPCTFLLNIINNFPPWGMYSADNWSNNTLYDMTGNNRHASTSNLGYNTSNGPQLYSNGANNQNNIIWPAGSIPAIFTIASVTRYNGAARQRVLCSQSTNWLHCHHGNVSGRSHYDGWKSWTDRTQHPTIKYDNFNLEWATCVGTNDTGVGCPFNHFVNGIANGNQNGGSGNAILCINNNPWNENSDFAFNQLIIWDKSIGATNMKIVSNSLLFMNNNGITLKQILGK